MPYLRLDNGLYIYFTTFTHLVPSKKNEQFLSWLVFKTLTTQFGLNVCTLCSFNIQLIV